MPITAIMIDSREDTWVKELKFGGIPTSVLSLDHGDLMAATDDGKFILVERKSPDDFLNTLREGRLLPQLSRMIDHTRWAYLVITGDLLRGSNGNVVTDRGLTGWNYSAVEGALISAQEMGIFVTRCGGAEDYEACILRLGNRDRNEEMLIMPPKFPAILSASEAVLAALPGIGIERLQTVLAYCGTPAWALVALTDPTSQIPGIPAGVKTKIRAALKLEDKTQLVVQTNELGSEVIAIDAFGSQ
jgi:ERCC4-type nuclease